MDNISNKKIKSLFEELAGFTLESDHIKVINNRSEHIFASVLHIFDLIEKEFNEEQSTMLLKFFMLAVKNKDYTRFKRQLLKLEKQNSKKA